MAKYWFDPKRNPIPEYSAWASMLKRCSNPKHPWYHRYGGRGITVCPQWRKDFLQFYLDVGSKPNPKYWLERVNNDKGYEPGNVIWASAKAQLNNTCANKRVEYAGKNLTVTQWAEELGTTRHTLYQRLEGGWDLDRVFTQPREIHNKKKSA